MIFLLSLAGIVVIVLVVALVRAHAYIVDLQYENAILTSEHDYYRAAYMRNMEQALANAVSN